MLGTNFYNYIYIKITSWWYSVSYGTHHGLFCMVILEYYYSCMVTLILFLRNSISNCFRFLPLTMINNNLYDFLEISCVRLTKNEACITDTLENKYHIQNTFYLSLHILGNDVHTVLVPNCVLGNIKKTKTLFFLWTSYYDSLVLCWVNILETN